MGRRRFYGETAPVLVVILSFAVALLTVSCTGVIPVQDGLDETEEQHAVEDGELFFTLPDDWLLVAEEHREEIVTLQMEKQGDDTVKLVATILPVELNGDALVLEARRTLEASLYQIQSISEAEEKEISGRSITFFDVVAGGKEKIFTRTACFAGEGRSYLLTLLGREDAFTRAAVDLERILTMSRDGGIDITFKD